MEFWQHVLSGWGISIPPVQYTKIVGVGGCPVVIAWMQNTSYTSLVPRLLCKAAHTREPGNKAIAAQARCTGFNSWLPAFFTFLYFRHLLLVYRTYFWSECSLSSHFISNSHYFNVRQEFSAPFVDALNLMMIFTQRVSTFLWDFSGSMTPEKTS